MGFFFEFGGYFFGFMVVVVGFGFVAEMVDRFVADRLLGLID